MPRDGDAPVFRYPRDDEHIAVIGRNGSGKTQLAASILAERSWNKKPWFVLDFKGEELLGSIPRKIEYDIKDKLPKTSGIYYARPTVVDKEDQIRLNDFFRRVWQRENVGVFVDEGYMATGLKFFRVCLTQGRSKRVPLFVLSQRPVYMDRFVWSEASHFIGFDLNLEDDVVTAGKMIPGYRRAHEAGYLHDYQSVYHGVKNDLTAILTPGPDAGTILQRFTDRLPHRHKLIT